MRMNEQTDVEFKTWLLRIGENHIADLPATAIHSNIVRVPNECVLDTDIDITSEIYGERIAATPNFQFFESRIILTTLNAHVEQFNQKCLEKMVGVKDIFCYSEDSIVEDTDNVMAHYPIEH